MRNKSPSKLCSHFCSKALFLPSIHSQQLFMALAELQLIFTPSDTMAALKCHCTCLHLSSFFQCLRLTPFTTVLAVWVLSWKIQTELSPLQRLLLTRCSSWCSSGFRKCKQKAFSPSFFQNIADISFACMAKSKHLLQGLFPVTLIGNAGSQRSSKWGNSLSLMQKAALQKQYTNRARHSLLTDLSLLAELAWNSLPVRQHFPLFTDLIERMIYQGSASHWVLLSAPKGNDL